MSTDAVYRDALFDVLLADTENLTKYIQDCIENKNAEASEFIANRYARVLKQCTELEINVDLSTVEDIKAIDSPHNRYPAYVSELTSLVHRVKKHATKREEYYIGHAFEEIQNIIINEVRKAKLLIWVNVAWFTDEQIFNSLIDAKNRGLNVQVITIKDKEKKNPLKFTGLIEVTYGSEYKLGNENLHDKFCVIDFETVIQGSYNWTNQAKLNYESISIVRKKETAIDYALRFVEIKKELKMKLK